MFPEITLLTLDLYEWLLLLGLISAFLVFRIYADKKRIPTKLFNLCLLFFVVAILVGFFFAIFFQAIYNFTQTKFFTINENTGMTFYGGLIGGAITFCTLYFTLGRKVCGKETVFREWNHVAGSATCSIALGHCLGRVGCFLVGCCYGIPTSSWIGVIFPALGYSALPTQLIEAVFLLLLFGVLTTFFFRTKIPPLALYVMTYGVFRFIIEFWRNDDRGASIIPPLSPSQCWSIALFLLGVILLIAPYLHKKRKGKQS